MQDSGSMAMFRLCSGSQPGIGQFKGLSVAFVTYCHSYCFSGQTNRSIYQVFFLSFLESCFLYLDPLGKKREMPGLMQLLENLVFVEFPCFLLVMILLRLS